MLHVPLIISFLVTSCSSAFHLELSPQFPSQLRQHIANASSFCCRWMDVTWFDMFQLDREFLARPSKDQDHPVECPCLVRRCDAQRTRPALRKHSSIPCRDSCEPQRNFCREGDAESKQGDHLKNNHGVACWDARAITPKGRWRRKNRQENEACEKVTDSADKDEGDDVGGPCAIRPDVWECTWCVPKNQQNTTSAYILCRSSSCFLDLNEFTHFII